MTWLIIRARSLANPNRKCFFGQHESILLVILPKMFFHKKKSYKQRNTMWQLTSYESVAVQISK